MEALPVSVIENLTILAEQCDAMAKDSLFSEADHEHFINAAISLRIEKLALMGHKTISLAVAFAIADGYDPVYLPEPMPDELRAEIGEEKTTQAQQDDKARNAGVVDGLLIVLALFALALIF